jgi:hypothetical protein
VDALSSAERKRKAGVESDAEEAAVGGAPLAVNSKKERKRMPTKCRLPISAWGGHASSSTLNGELHFEFSKQRIVAKRPSRSVEPPGHDMLVDEVWSFCKGDSCEWHWPAPSDSAQHVASMKPGQRSPNPLTVTFKTSAMKHPVEIPWSNAILAARGEQIVAAIEKCRDVLGDDAVTVVDQPEVVCITTTARKAAPHVPGKVWALFTHVYNKYSGGFAKNPKVDSVHFTKSDANAAAVQWWSHEWIDDAPQVECEDPYSANCCMEGGSYIMWLSVDEVPIDEVPKNVADKAINSKNGDFGWLGRTSKSIHDARLTLARLSGAVA